MNRVYPVGTDSYKAIERIDELMKQLKTLLIDVRLNAYSWRLDFKENALRRAYNERYHMAGKYLGNLARWSTGLVKIASPVAGIHGLVNYLNEGYDVVLLYHDDEHIKEICRLLVGVRPETEMVKHVPTIQKGSA